MTPSLKTLSLSSVAGKESVLSVSAVVHTFVSPAGPLSSLPACLLIAGLGFCGSLHAQTIPAQNTTYQYEYDELGNVTKITSPLKAVTQQRYDALGRLQSQTDANNQTTSYGYDGQNRLTQVTDARNLTTRYTIDGLGNQLGLSSPDTGSTTTTADAAGNILSSTDAKGQTTRYTYDVLNRLTSISYSDGQVTSYTYDQGDNAKGRLTQIQDASGSIQLSYDSRGRVLSETRSLNNGGTPLVSTTRYQWDSMGRLQQLTYPNGRQIRYTRDNLGRITQIDTSKDGMTQTLLSQISYRPFGGVQSYLNSTGQSYTRSFDADGRITGYTLNNLAQSISYDAANRITSISEANNNARQSSYGYDNLDRLTSYLSAQTNQNFSYDAVGNRNSKTTGSTTTSYSYSPASNRLTQISGSQTSAIQMDANGSTTSNGNAQMSYDARGRLVTVKTAAGTVQYQINAYGQRVQKTGPTASTWYHYDQSGRLISERTGQSDTDYVYLDDIPVVVLK